MVSEKEKQLSYWFWKIVLEHMWSLYYWKYSFQGSVLQVIILKQQLRALPSMVMPQVQFGKCNYHSVRQLQTIKQSEAAVALKWGKQQLAFATVTYKLLFRLICKFNFYHMNENTISGDAFTSTSTHRYWWSQNQPIIHLLSPQVSYPLNGYRTLKCSRKLQF